LVGQYRAVGRYDRALEHLIVLRTLSALGSLAFLEEEARLRLSMAQGDEVLALLDEALAVGRRVDGPFLALLAETYRVLNRRADGIARLRELAAIVPDQVENIERELAVLSSHFRVAPRAPSGSQETIETIEKAIGSLRPKWNQTSPATSAREFSKRLEAERQRLHLQLRLSFIQRDQGHRSACELTLLDLLSRHPLLAVALNSLAYLWAEDGRRLDEALVLQKRALEQEPFSGAFQDTMGWIQFRRGRIDEALRHLEFADRYQPDEPEIIEHLAEVLRASGLTEEAAEHDLRARLLRDRALPR
jgi:tetratricopeptide (TPR) repeat protein